ncbi:cytochrome P450 [Nocardia sp. NPDC052566]|uniref:cytochrome P450 n=1 Tax=Nocardia sp. NPDC052566 TaxID=3364330 RepID=UPI0037C56673
MNQGSGDEMRQLPPDFFHTPYAFYAELRAEGPVHEIELRTGMRAWLVVDYDAAREVMRHPSVCKDLFSSAGTEALRRFPRDPEASAADLRLSYHMLNSDPPKHTRLRRLVAPAFAPARMEALAPRVRAIADGLLDAIEGRADQVDLLAEYAFPLPMTVICELLGIPVADRDQFRRWTAAVVDATTMDRAELRRMTHEIADYFEGLVAERRAGAQGEDLLSALVAASEDGDRLSDDELLSMVFLIMIAGHETTVNLIGNTVLTLLSDPPRYHALRADPAAVAPLLEEMLRYESPVNVATLRYTTAPVMVYGTEIPAHELVLVALGSANHDDRHFTGAARFDPVRNAAGHVAFGHGIHFCLGAGLARMEGRIAIDRLIRRFPELRLAVDSDDIRWRESILIRGLCELPVDLAGAPALR